MTGTITPYEAAMNRVRYFADAGYDDDPTLEAAYHGTLLACIAVVECGPSASSKDVYNCASKYLGKGDFGVSLYMREAADAAVNGDYGQLVCGNDDVNFSRNGLLKSLAWAFEQLIERQGEY